MLFRSLYRRLYIPFLLLITISGCKVNPIPDSPPHIKTPGSFIDNGDSISIADLAPSEFFKDPYLVGLIDTALKNNFDLRIAVQRIAMAEAGILYQRGALVPTVNGVASAGAERFGYYTMNGVGNYYNNQSPGIRPKEIIPNPTPDYFIGFRSYWEIDIWGKLRNRKKAAYARFLASEKGKNLIKTSLVAEVAKLYYELLSLDNKLQILRKNIALQETALEIINIQKNAGKVTELAVEQFTAQLLNTKSREAEIRQEIVIAENDLNTLLGRYPQTIQRAGLIREQELPEKLAAGIPSEMLLRRPDIQEAELELAATKADIEAARLAFLPSLTLNAQAGLNAYNAVLLPNPASAALALYSGISAPLFNRRVLRANLSTMKARNQEALLQYQKSIVNGFQEVITHLKGIENYKKIYDLKEQQAAVLQAAVSTSNDLFISGFATYLEVFTAQKNVLEAELGLINAQKAQFFALINLYRALGGGWK